MNKELIKEYAARFKGDEEYVMKTTQAVVELDNGVLLGIEKPRIETRFCFHDEGPEYEYYKDLMDNKETMLKEYFFKENLKELYKQIQRLQGGITDDYPRFIGVYLNEEGTASLSWRAYHMISDKGLILEGLAAHEKDPNFKPLINAEERKRVLEALQEVRAAFEKRLHTWWKRYGADKLITWTFWANA